MLQQIRTVLVALLLFTLFTGVVYPLAVTGIAMALFPAKATGSILFNHGKPVGSSLIGQALDAPGYFWGRLSATSPMPCNASASTGSNYGPLNPALVSAAQGRITALHQADPDNQADIPVDLVTASGSGIDPHISPAAAAYQLHRVAQARGMSDDQVRELVDRYTEGRTFGVLGEPRVNVLQLNLALDAGKP